MLHNSNPALFAERLVTLRLAAGLRQHELAAKVGVHVTTLSQWERGTREPPMADILGLCMVLGVTPNDLIW